MSEAHAAIERRLFALSRTHDVLTREKWEGAFLTEIISQAIDPFRSYGEARFHVRGPEIRLSPRMALALSMALHELATNAVKHGALSGPSGEVHLIWSIDRTSTSPRLRLRWEEKHGPLEPFPAIPSQRDSALRPSVARLLPDMEARHGARLQSGPA
jgi:two-component sensor histidine kinase